MLAVRDESYLVVLTEFFFHSRSRRTAFHTYSYFHSYLLPRGIITCEVWEIEVREVGGQWDLMSF